VIKPWKDRVEESAHFREEDYINDVQYFMQEEIGELRAENARLRDALADIAYGLEGSRIWGGMEWSYAPLHPFKYLPLRDKARAALRGKP